MKAIRAHAFGGPEVLRLEEVDDPVAGAGEVVIGVRAAGVNPRVAMMKELDIRGTVLFNLTRDQMAPAMAGILGPTPWPASPKACSAP